MLKTIVSYNDMINAFIWGVPSMICIMGVGIWLTLNTRFIQFRKFGYTLPVRMYRAGGNRWNW